MFLLDMGSAFIMLWKTIAALYQTSNGIQDVFLCIFFFTGSEICYYCAGAGGSSRSLQDAQIVV